MAKAGTGLNFGIQECSKCQYKLRCDECVYNGKDISKIVNETRKETAEKFAERVSKAFIGLNCIDIDEWNWCQRKIDEICKKITEGKNGAND